MASAAAAAAALVVVVLAVVVSPASGQVATSCTASLITTFTPCLNFVTGSTNGGGSPTQQCCGSLAEMTLTTLCCILVICRYCKPNPTSSTIAAGNVSAAEFGR
uniref:Bifunctional inhibitor/plant lipid transfer protein/seed storage helical domain-containing protein n=1 Tax=Oryza rufipogon TaxID=4529 RepID=A0A0E0P2F8_ORYRU